MSAEDVFKICEKKLDGSRYDEAEIREAIEEAEYEIRNFTGRWQYEVDPVTGDSKVEELPMQLNYIWAGMAIGILYLDYRITQTTSAVVENESIVTEVKEGDTTIKMVQTEPTYRSILEVIGQYAAELTPFRRLYPAVREV